MNLLSDIVTYIRRIIKSPSNAQITDALIIDYINRFWLMDVDARIQLFDLKTKYQFQTTPGVSDYNMPLYDVQVEAVGNPDIGMFPVYQGFMQSCYANGIQVPFYTQQNSFWNLWPNYLQFLPQTGIGNGTTGPYTLTIPYFPAIQGHVDISGIMDTEQNVDPPLVASYTFPASPTDFIPDIRTTSVYSAVYFSAVGANGQNIVIADSGEFLSDNTDNDIYGLLMVPGHAPYGNTRLLDAIGNPGYSTTLNTINYNTGIATNVFFPVAIPDGTPIQAQCYFYQQGLPRAILFYNNCITVRPPPDTQYLIEMEAYITPAAFLSSTDAIPFGYMAEYIARGAARKILADTGDTEQFMFYEPLFKEQEILVWKRSQRQFTATRTGTIFSDLQGQSNYNNIGQGST